MAWMMMCYLFLKKVKTFVDMAWAAWNIKSLLLNLWCIIVGIVVYFVILQAACYMVRQLGL